MKILIKKIYNKKNKNKCLEVALNIINNIQKDETIDQRLHPSVSETNVYLLTHI